MAGKDIKCEKNEEMNVCGKLCEASCNNPNSDSELCPPIVSPGIIELSNRRSFEIKLTNKFQPCNSEITRDCRCAYGTVRDEKTKACIPLSKCPNIL